MTLDAFIDKWNGKKADWDGAYAGQCVDLFRYYCNEVLNIPQPDGVWGAANFWTNYETDNVLKMHFDKVPNTPEFTPEKGDVMVWDFNAGGGFGHIGMCTGENTGTQYFKSFDQNWSRVSYCEIVNHSYKNVYGVLRPKGGNLNTYKGLDLTNQESMKVAVDTWYAVVYEGKYVEKSTVEALKEDFKLQLEAKDKRIAEEVARYDDICEWMASELGTGKTEPEIKAEISRLVNVEDALSTCRDDKVELEKKAQLEANRADEILNELSVLTGTTVASSKGISRALATYLKANSANPTIDTYSAYDLLVELFKRSTKWLQRN